MYFFFIEQPCDTLRAFWLKEGNLQSISWWSFQASLQKRISVEKKVSLIYLKGLIFPLTHLTAEVRLLSSPSMRPINFFNILLTPRERQSICSKQDITYMSIHGWILTKKNFANTKKRTAWIPPQTVTLFLVNEFFQAASISAWVATKRVFGKRKPNCKLSFGILHLRRGNFVWLPLLIPSKFFVSVMSATYEDRRKWTGNCMLILD